MVAGTTVDVKAPGPMRRSGDGGRLRQLSWVLPEAPADEQTGWVWQPRSRSGGRRVSPEQALAEASGLTRIGPMLQLLGQQVRMLIAVVGITYAFPIEPIVARDRAILAAIDEGDDELAAQRWREKIDEAVAYMLEQVESVRGRPARLTTIVLGVTPPAAPALRSGR